MQATGDQDCFLFAQSQLLNLSKWAEIDEQLRARNVAARPLRSDDYNNGYLELLSQLTHVGAITNDEFRSIFDKMKKSNLHFIVVIEDTQTKRIVGASTLVLEYKYIHQGAIRGRVEDVAVLDSYRGKQIGELTVRIMVELAHEVHQCYKLSLDCKDELKEFYSRNNFVYGGNMLENRFRN